MKELARSPSLRLSLIGLILLLAACNSGIEDGNVQSRLHFLEKTFGIPWPTDCTKAFSVTFSSDRKISEVVVRLEMTEATFQSWRQTATNKLTEYRGLSFVEDRKLAERLEWWDCSKLPASQIIQFASNKRAGNQNAGELTVYAIETNRTCIMYVHGCPAH